MSDLPPTEQSAPNGSPSNPGSAVGAASQAFDEKANSRLFSSRYREVTLAAIVFGVVLGGIMNAAITYAGLKIGFTIVGSAIAAVLGFGVLRGMLRKGSILETNIAQTIASAVNTPNSGVIFTVPVLLLLGYNLNITEPNFWLITLACVAGAILGCAFIVPLRKQMLDIERLRFPSATAVAAILKSPGAGPKKSIVLLIGIILSAIIAVPAQFPALTRPAKLDKLEALVAKERITRADMLLTKQIDGWITAQSAPAELIEHGKLAEELVHARAENQPKAKQGLTVEQAAERSRAVKVLEERVANAQALAVAAIAAAEPDPSDRGRLMDLGYPLELAKRAHHASQENQPKAWASLRSVSAGWAPDRPFGYADLQIRMPATPAEGNATADYEFNGLGNESPVLAVKVDRDRGGVPDLIVQDESVDVGRWLGLPDQMQLIFAIAPFAIGAGYLTGRAGLFVLAGGVLAYLIINPVLYGMGWLPATVQAHEAPGFVFGSINRPLGIGLLLGGAMMGVVASLPAIKSAFKSIASSGGARGVPTGKDELGLRVLIVSAFAALILLFVAADFTSKEPINTHDPITQEAIETDEFTAEHNGYVIAFAAQDTLDAFASADHERKNAEVKELAAHKAGLLAKLPPHVRAAIIAVVGALWIWFAGIIIAQCTGMTDWSPISGMALLTVVLIMLLGGPGGVIGAVLLGAALCVAVTCASDMMSDLKTGYLVGASPRRQQVVELVATGIGPLITMAVLLVIVATNQQKYGVPIGPGTDTVAPQAQALEAVITGVQGGAMPYALYGFGALLGALLGLGAFSGLGVLVGLSIYLPMLYISTYGIGCLINMLVSKIKGPKWAEEWGVPLAAGFIVGDALLSLSVNAAVLILG